MKGAERSKELPLVLEYMCAVVLCGCMTSLRPAERMGRVKGEASDVGPQRIWQGEDQGRAVIWQRTRPIAGSFKEKGRKETPPGLWRKLIPRST
jgi:hypothetical protein